MSLAVSQAYTEILASIGQQQRVGSSVVVVDGASGSGKTALARRLAKDLAGGRISTDCYVVAGTEGSYLERLDLEFLSDDLRKFQRVFPFVIFDGICARDLLNRFEVRWAHSVYVKKLASNGLWHFNFHVEDFEAGTLHEEDQMEPFRSDYEYHSRVRPHESADFMFTRVAD